MIKTFDFDEQQLKDSTKLHGSMNKCIIAMEECSELQKAISKIIRENAEEGSRYAETTNENKKAQLVEEMGDVLCCIAYLQGIFDISDMDLQAVIDEKQKRQVVRDRIQKQREHSGRYDWGERNND